MQQQKKPTIKKNQQLKKKHRNQIEIIKMKKNFILLLN